jgi:hypothetical protein
MVGCRATEVVYVDAIHTEEVIVHDTIVEVKVPEHYTEVVTMDTASHLENPYAYSDAVVSGGRLTHSLGTRGTVKERVVYTETIIRDSIPYPVEVEVPVYVDKELRWWQRSLMWTGGLSMGAVMLYLAFKLGIQK